MGTAFRTWGWLLRFAFCRFPNAFSSLPRTNLSHLWNLWPTAGHCFPLGIPNWKSWSLFGSIRLDTICWKEEKVPCPDSQLHMCLHSVFPLEGAEDQARLLWMQVLRKHRMQVGSYRVQSFLLQQLPCSGWLAFRWLLVFPLLQMLDVSCYIHRYFRFFIYWLSSFHNFLFYFSRPLGLIL